MGSPLKVTVVGLTQCTFRGGECKQASSPEREVCPRVISLRLVLICNGTDSGWTECCGVCLRESRYMFNRGLPDMSRVVWKRGHLKVKH